MKSIMKAYKDVRLISAEAPTLFANACELFILKRTIWSWLHAKENKSRIDPAEERHCSSHHLDIHFLISWWTLSRDEIEDEGRVVPVVPSSGVPY
ncbi:nuclear transcription factor Y subunit C-1-like protein [Cinnamomum micranthum f. kanehirae]|uniref:Nuclear transcription factor Y subunit C-1-like protein n=1 Tax=Cinnamomum micranthum f. kanehirae TaxID=337451 RepID=A0A443P2A7_9MAGN|nr:nuclear transcription factor Y subunit C-1-like protein [Cinnamomum micranthum f. kanehirae]